MRSAEVRRHAALLGVPEGQVRRDVLISRVLSVLPDALDDAGSVVFFGGTALCRTHLEGFRLSEDIDLLAVRPAAVLAALADRLPRLLRRDHPGLRLDPPSRDGGTHVSMLRDEATDFVRVQTVSLDASYRRYPTASMPVELRYPGLPATVDLVTPTVAAAGAMKLNAWADRGLPRDLADLYELVRRGLLDVDAVRIAGEVAAPLPAHVFADERRPAPGSWHTALSAQMREVPDPGTAFRLVRAQVARLRGWPEADQWTSEADR